MPAEPNRRYAVSSPPAGSVLAQQRGYSFRSAAMGSTFMALLAGA